MEKLLFIAFYYNHDNEIASKRLQGIAKYLSKYNWQPIVTVPKTSNPTVRSDNVKIVETDYEGMISKFIPKSKSKESKSESTSQNLADEFFAYPDKMKYCCKPEIKEASNIIENENISGMISSSFPVPPLIEQLMI